MDNKLELPFKQLLWTLYKLREAQKNYDSTSAPYHRISLKQWKDKTDTILETMGVNENTTWSNIKISFTDGDSSR